MHSALHLTGFSGLLIQLLIMIGGLLALFVPVIIIVWLIRRNDK